MGQALQRAVAPGVLPVLTSHAAEGLITGQEVMMMTMMMMRTMIMMMMIRG